MTTDINERTRFTDYFTGMGASYVDVSLGLLLATRHPEWAWYWAKKMETDRAEDSALTDLIVDELPVAVEA